MENQDKYPLISVIIPTYKRADYLERAIESVLEQTYPNVEVVVVDDNDPTTRDRMLTEQMMEKYAKNNQVRYVKHSENKNGAAARNTGIKHSSGEYICFLDDDDWFLEEKLMLQYQYLKEHQEYEAVYCGWEREGTIVLPYKTGDLTFELLSGVEIVYTNTIMVKREKAILAGGWDERFRRNQEAVFLIRLFSVGVKIGVVSEKLVMFDIEDRRNESDAKRNHQDFVQYLVVHRQQIEQCRKRYSDAKERIYSYRYRGILLTYLKTGEWKDAVKFFFQATRELSFRFPKDCMIYAWRKIRKIPLYKEYKS